MQSLNFYRDESYLNEEISKNGYIFPTKYPIYMIDNAFESLILEL